MLARLLLVNDFAAARLAAPFDPVSTLPPALTTSPMLDYLQQVHARHAGLREGQVATYIPELAKADPDWFSICVVTTGGHVYEVGDSRQPFTIQSISKPFVYGLALQDHGLPHVLEHVGVEPSGDAFNSISLDPPPFFQDEDTTQRPTQAAGIGVFYSGVRHLQLGLSGGTTFNARPLTLRDDTGEELKADPPIDLRGRFLLRYVW